MEIPRGRGFQGKWGRRYTSPKSPFCISAVRIPRTT